jgi:hypothetical protein
MHTMTPTSTRLLGDVIKTLGDVRESVARVEGQVEILSSRLNEHIENAPAQPPPSPVAGTILTWALAAFGMLATAVGGWLAAQ